MIKIKKKIVLIGVVASAVVAVGAVLGFSILGEYTKFEQLDKDMTTLYQRAKSESSRDNLSYKKQCTDLSDGAWTNGKKVCALSISLTTEVDSAVTALNLHEKYYALFNNSPLLAQSAALKIEPDNFGKAFVVSNAHQDYAVISTKTICAYETHLGQTESSYDNFYTSTPITTPKAQVTVSFTCSEPARFNWYTN